MNTLKNLDAILHEQLLEIIDSQIFNGASILNAIKICNELKRNLQDFHNAAYSGERYDFGASAFNVDISMEDTVYKFDLESRLPHTLRADSKLNPLLGEQADSFFPPAFVQRSGIMKRIHLINFNMYLSFLQHFMKRMNFGWIQTISTISLS